MHVTTLYLACVLVAQADGPAVRPAPGPPGSGPPAQAADSAPSFGSFGNFGGSPTPANLSSPPVAPVDAGPRGSFNPAPTSAPAIGGGNLSNPPGQPMSSPGAPGRFEPTPGASRTSAPTLAPTLAPTYDAPGTAPPVARTAMQSPVTPSKTSLARTLLTQAAAVDETDAVGQPIRLYDSIERATDRARQLQTIKAYWRLSLARLDATYAAQEQSWLTQVPQPQAADQQAQLQAAQYAAAARDTEAQLALAAMQHDFSTASELAAESPQFIPADLPFSGEYRTNFRALFSGRVPPAALLRVERTLPGYYQLLNIRAEAVESAALALEATDGAYRKGQAGILDLLTAYERLQRQRIAFLQTVGEYNYSIADYALAVAGPNVSRQAVVAMLIESTPAAAPTSTASAGLIRRTSAEEPIPAEAAPLAAQSADAAPILDAPANSETVVAPANYESPLESSQSVLQQQPTSAGPLAPVGPPQQPAGAPGPVVTKETPSLAPPGSFAPQDPRPLQQE